MRAKLWLAVFLIGTGANVLTHPGIADAQGKDQNQDANHGMAAGMAADAGKPKASAGLLKISFGARSSEWTPATMAALPHKTLTVYNEHVKVNQTYSGVELIDLLKPLGVPEKPHGKEFAFYLVAEGSDGYQVVYSIGEVTPDVHDGTVMVADALDGKPITDNGPLQLVTTGEKRPARWVRNLIEIRVQAAQ